MLDLVVEGNAYLDGALNKCCVGIENGKIVAIKKILKGDLHFDFGDKLLLPAGMDIHVHFRDPGFLNKEDFYTGSLSAAFGGISCVLDMPNTKPAVNSKKTVLEKLKIVSKKSLIDFGLYSSISSRTNISATAKVCSAFKIYLASTTGDLLFSDKNSLDYVLSKINDNGRIPAIHAESESVILAQKKQNPPPKNLHEYLRARPNDAEAQAMSNILEIMSHWDLNNNIKSYKNQNHETILKTNYHWYWQDLKKSLQTCGFNYEQWSTHDFRKNAAQDIYEDTRDPYAVKEFLNHEDFRATEHYLKNQGLLKNQGILVINLIEKLLF